MHTPSHIAENWTVEHYVLYIFLCVASSDLHLDESELEEIENAVTDTLGVEKIEGYPILLKQVLEEVEKHDETTKKGIIEKYKDEYLLTKGLKNRLVQSIEEIIIADLSVDESEMEYYRFFKKLVREN